MAVSKKDQSHIPAGHPTVKEPAGEVLITFPPNSKEREAFLALGYGMDKAKAETIIKERKENPALWPFEMKEKAEAFLAALAAK